MYTFYMKDEHQGEKEKPLIVVEASSEVGYRQFEDFVLRLPERGQRFLAKDGSQVLFRSNPETEYDPRFRGASVVDFTEASYNARISDVDASWERYTETVENQIIMIRGAKSAGADE